MKLKPNFDRLIVKPEAKEESASGLLRLDADKEEHPERGTVIAIGHVTEDRGELPFKDGDTVVFKKYSPDTVELDSETYLVLHINDCYRRNCLTYEQTNLV